MADDPKPGGSPRKVRLIEIAQKVGLSRATVSLALRRHPSIPKQTRERIEAAARELGYVYNRGAASLRTASTHTVGIVVNDLTNPYFAEIVAAVQEEMTRIGRVVLFGNSQETPERQAEFIETFREYNVDGIILCPSAGTDPATIRDVQDSGLPLVLFSRDMPGVDADYVGGANLDGMRSATAHLIALGHRRIAMVGINRKIATGRDRLGGYGRALEEAGLAFDASIVVDGPATREFGMAAIGQLLAADGTITACVCFNDVVAFGVMLGLRRAGREAGADFSVVGFDDIAEASLWQPALTSLFLSRQEIGRHAASLLMRRLGNPSAPPSRVILPFVLAERDSVQPLHHAGGRASQ
ncbi:LacI family DNA-binding transcriptional regulator [Acuticoccus sp. MNP-M23]|uniref:LacI family DNA-binding transcriptional regulator n=1 Tax=Acuticoccus sp. MNP-M23 TaxID=3072793 RepID=UPI002814FBF6|nr:LacI family DNA-binding transcriptional regulator [Acuticoccus sp. MNP-M23]WMS41374.1 LacI family DNA-binding transcriptional regulator [Acuticoccus sp. MNP-M23]